MVFFALIFTSAYICIKVELASQMPNWWNKPPFLLSNAFVVFSGSRYASFMVKLLFFSYMPFVPKARKVHTLVK